MVWTNFAQHAPEFEAIKKEIAGWAARTAQPFAGMPRSTEPGYEARMREAYISMCENIVSVAKDPQSRASGVLMGHMWVQAEGFSSRIKVDSEEFNPEKGAKHILAGLPAIVAGRYRQL